MGNPLALKMADAAKPQKVSRTLDKVVRRVAMDMSDVPYKFIKTLGQGSYGKVRLPEHLHTGEKVAIKCITKSKLRRVKDYVRVEREIKLMKLLKHQHIIELKDVRTTYTHHN